METKMLCKDCGVFTSVKVISDFEEKIKQLSYENEKLKKENKELNSLRDEVLELRIVKKQIITNNESKNDKRFWKW